MDDYVLAACQPATIVIPGIRLWRSTRVTLGSQRADRIEVLPNMEGIIAYFDEVLLPRVDTGRSEGNVPLRVWTSEGMDDARTKVRIMQPALDPERSLCGLEGARYQEKISSIGAAPL
jgi:hypothetical protein